MKGTKSVFQTTTSELPMTTWRRKIVAEKAIAACAMVYKSGTTRSGGPFLQSDAGRMPELNQSGAAECCIASIVLAARSNGLSDSQGRDAAVNC
jgi:hypothetical protein